MISSYFHRIHNNAPLLHKIREKGYTPVDMHVHTYHSDAAISIPSLLSRAEHLGIGVAVTDHNEIQGVIEAHNQTRDVLVIPGIELSSQEGPHVLLYFYNVSDLADFFTTYIKANLRKCQYMAIQLSVEKILAAAEMYACLKVAAHPYGYFGINRGILKCIDNKTLPEDIIGHIDAIEVICGGMSQDLNARATRYAVDHDSPVTGGSDAHVIPSVGGVVTGVKTDTVGGFLDGILAKESIVIGSSANPLHKGMAAGVIAWNYIPYTVSSLQVHYEQNIPRMKRYLDNMMK